MPQRRPPVLSEQVLLLNRHFTPVGVIDVRECFGLLAREVAEVVDVRDGAWQQFSFDEWLELGDVEPLPDDDWISTVTLRIRVPRVLRLRIYDRVHRRDVKFSRRAVFLRDEYRCVYCGRRLPASKLSLDHVLPRSLGGESRWENLVTACMPCNVRKGQRTPDKAGMRLLYRPARPSFHPVIASAMRNEKYRVWRVFLPRWNPSPEPALHSATGD
ncbi:MAG: HNH endonuclease [Planctomycetes bacterium]|nr:HNH endonuclease [Planctomycetota bacterium]